MRLAPLLQIVLGGAALPPLESRFQRDRRSLPSGEALRGHEVRKAVSLHPGARPLLRVVRLRSVRLHVDPGPVRMCSLIPRRVRHRLVPFLSKLAVVAAGRAALTDSTRLPLGAPPGSRSGLLRRSNSTSIKSGGHSRKAASNASNASIGTDRESANCAPSTIPTHPASPNAMKSQNTSKDFPSSAVAVFGAKSGSPSDVAPRRCGFGTRGSTVSAPFRKLNIHVDKRLQGVSVCMICSKPGTQTVVFGSAECHCKSAP